MKQKLIVVIALALSSALLAGCERPAGDAGSGDTSSSQPKKSTTPGSTTPPPSK